ncbi:hypothetical protein GCM10022393_00650 [Aquimarina addita]|uniref:Uncharacterized protein n=2 Tax=Aquimarina addita TaxID=870485 RepID=A0ABP7X723_9FLAO
MIVYLGTIGYAQGRYEESPNTYKFRYKSEAFRGSRLSITAKLRAIKNSPKYSGIPAEIQVELDHLFIAAKDQALPKLYKENAILFLDALYRYEEFVILYNNSLYEVIEKLKRDMKRIDFKLEREFTKSKAVLDRTQKEDPTNTKEINHIEKELYKNQVRLASHRWMKKKFDTYKGINMVEQPDQLIKDFKQQAAAQVFSLFNEEKKYEIKTYLENEIIEFYYNKSLAEIDPEILDLQYINKI